MTEGRKKRFLSIRTRLFLQVGFVILIAIVFILVLNNFLLPNIYLKNEKRTMKNVYSLIDSMPLSQEGYARVIRNHELANNYSIDIYYKDGTPIYYGTDELFGEGGKVTITRDSEENDGSYFEKLTNESTKAQYIVYVAKLSIGGEIEIYARTDTIDENARTAILITSLTSVAALLLALILIFIYTGRFTKPLIKMSTVTAKMAEMDFSAKCEVKGNDELTMLSDSINEMSDSLDSTLKDLNDKNEQLKADIEKEKTLEKIRKDFISNVSHELKTPISIIRGYSEGAELLLEQGNTDSAKEYCGIIVGETEKMNTLVLQLLELSMYESGSVGVDARRIDLRMLVEDYADDNSLKLNEKGITFENEVENGLFGLGDPVKIEMVVNNYISNAISHCDGEKLIKVTCEDRGEFYRLCVFNTGEHIADEDIDKIWISFYRADKARSRSEGRFGLGLSIVSAIQKLHGADYGVFNTDGGVCFWFDIKADREQGESAES